MANVLIVVHLLIVLALIGVILMQRSEGGALGIGGGGGMSRTRTSANLLTRTTAILAALFFATSIGLTVINELDRGSQGILENAVGSGTQNSGGTEQPTSVLDALNKLQGEDEGLAVPANGSDSTTPASGSAAGDTTSTDASGASNASSSDTPDLAVPGSGSSTDGNSGN